MDSFFFYTALAVVILTGSGVAKTLVTAYSRAIPRRVAVIGLPGAGKTTLITAVFEQILSRVTAAPIRIDGLKTVEVVNKNIEPAPRCIDLPEHFQDRFWIGNIRLNGDGFALLLFDRLDQRVRRFGVGHEVDRHFCASFGQSQCYSRANAGIAARDEGALAVKSDIHDGASC